MMAGRLAQDSFLDGGPVQTLFNIPDDVFTEILSSEIEKNHYKRTVLPSTGLDSQSAILLMCPQ